MTDYQPQPSQSNNTTRNIIIVVVVVVLLCCCCLAAFFLLGPALLGPSIGNVFSNIIQNLELTPAP
jgi:flagellar basal body-associated protein FliL